MKTHTWKTSCISKGPARLKMPKQSIMGEIISQSASAQIQNAPPGSLPSARAFLDYILRSTLHGCSDACLMVAGQTFTILITHAKLTCWVHLWSLCVHPSAQTGATISQPHYLGMTSSDCHYATPPAYWEKTAREIQNPTKYRTKSRWPQWHVRAMMRSAPL